MAELIYQIKGDSSGLTTATKQATSSLNSLDQSVSSTNKNIQNEITSLINLQRQLKNLNADKVNIIDAQQLAKQNALIQELEAEIKRASNVGKVGFDATGVSLKELEKGTAGVSNGFTKAFSGLRTLAYILPGIGIAGIFNLAFEAIAKAAEELNLFSSKLTVAESNLNNLNEVTKNAGKQFGEQSTNLKILFQATQDVTLSEKERLLAAQELQKEFPSLFGNIKTETILNGGAATAYRDATVAILENAKAKAAASKIAELAGQQLQADIQIQKIQIANANELNRINTGAGLDVQFKTRGANERDLLRNESNDRKNASIELQKQRKADLQSQIDFLIQFAGGNNKIAAVLDAGQKIKTPSAGGENTFAALLKQLDDIFNKSAHLADQSGLSGYALEVQKINDKYKDLNRGIDDVIKKGQTDLKGGKITQSQFGVLSSTAAKDQTQLAKDQAKELGDAKIKETERVANEIQRINDEFGVRSEQSRQKELDQINLRYDKEVIKAQGNNEILKAIDAGRATAIQAVNDKYVQIYQDLQDKIITINDQAHAEIGDKTQVETGRIVKEWETRRQAANKYFHELQLIAASQLSADPLTAATAAVGIAKNIQNQAGVNSNITNAESADINLAKNRDLLSSLDQGLSGVISDFTSGLLNANQTIGADFESVFSGIASSFAKTMEGVAISGISTFLKEKLQQGIKDGTIHMSGTLAAGIAGAAVLGGVISGITPKTSIVGQGLGGALSGAATGAAIGSIVPGIGTAVGAVAGGVVGLLGGIFGASKAQKELQQQQLQQAQEQTAALKASLAYTSSIIGRMTAQGVITGFDVGSGGQLTARISGKDLQFVLDRNNNGR